MIVLPVVPQARISYSIPAVSDTGRLQGEDNGPFVPDFEAARHSGEVAFSIGWPSGDYSRVPSRKGRPPFIPDAEDLD